MTFSTSVREARWQEDKAVWNVKLETTDDSGRITETTDECDILLAATGVLNNFKWPDIKGIDEFKGKVIHTARWPDEYQQDEWAKDRVAIIGSGASSVQTVPTMQPHVKHMDVFIRTPVWFVDIAGNEGKNIECKFYNAGSYGQLTVKIPKRKRRTFDKTRMSWCSMQKVWKTRSTLASICSEGARSCN